MLATDHPNGDAVPGVPIQHQSSLGKIIRNLGVLVSASGCCPAEAPAEATGFTL